MRFALTLISMTALLGAGCSLSSAPTLRDVVPFVAEAGVYPNPVHIGGGDPLVVWETVADVTDDYFPDFEHEQPLRQVGELITEGRLQTFPRGSPTVLEPWRRDASDGYQDIENTLQTMRRYAVVRVIPDESGYLLDLAVYKELEDLPRPERSTAGAATLRFDDTLRRVDNPAGDQVVQDRWIPQGRDTALEQQMIAHMLSRLGRTSTPTILPPAGGRPLVPVR